MKLIAIFLMIISLNSFAIEASGNVVDAETFNQELNLEESAQFYPWISHPTTCYAQTICPNGRRIFCQTYGYNYSLVPSTFYNSCRSVVFYGRGVRCQGYAQQRNIYGQFFWSWVDIPVTCF